MASQFILHRLLGFGFNSAQHPLGCRYTVKLCIDPLFQEVPNHPGFPSDPCRLSNDLISLRVLQTSRSSDTCRRSDFTDFRIVTGTIHVAVVPVSVSPNLRILLQQDWNGSMGAFQPPAPVVAAPAQLRDTRLHRSNPHSKCRLRRIRVE